MCEEFSNMTDRNQVKVDVLIDQYRDIEPEQLENQDQDPRPKRCDSEINF